MNDRPPQQRVTRRHLLQLAGSATVAGLAGCSAIDSRSPVDDSPPPRSAPSAGPPDTTARLTPAAEAVDLSTGETYESYFYDERSPVQNSA